MRALTDTMRALMRRLEAAPRGVDLSGRDITTARALANRRLATRVRKLSAEKTLNGHWLRREVWRLTNAGFVYAGELSRAQSTRTSRAPKGGSAPRRAAHSRRAS